MSINVTWDNTEHTIVRWEFNGAWDWDEFYDAFAQSKALVQSSSDPSVAVICDLRRSAGLPEQFMAHYPHVHRDKSDNRGMIVVVGSSSFIKAAIRTFNQVFGRWLKDEIRTAASLEEARALIAQAREQT